MVWALVPAVLACLPGVGHSQQYLMGEEASVTACGFYFLDDGGALNDASSSGEYTTTFCPETAGGALTFSFSTFTLGEGDTLFLWQGPTALGPPSFAYTGAVLLGNDLGNGDNITNPSGCMTWRYSPSGSGSSNWAALVSCSAPCDRPLVSALVSLEGQLQSSPVQTCLGTGLLFDATGSTSAVGLEGSTWAWDFGDGTNSVEGGVLEHTYTQPGIYPVQLTLTDSAGCSSVNSLGWTVHVAAAIGIDAPSVGPLVCAGGAAVLALGPEGVSTQAVESQPVATFGAGVVIPDSVGVAFSSEITFSGFPLGQSVSGLEDIGGVLVNLEHSFILDLAIELECPNGSSMVLQGWPGGFGGCVDAGIPITGDSPPQPGLGYDYSWSPSASQDWQAAAMEQLPNPSSGCASSTLPLPAGAYAATGDWNQLIGCPVNGTWTLNILDTQEGDNGFLFGWSMDFASEITPEQTSFEATVGSSCDSMFWSPMEPWGFDIASIDGCSSIVVEPTEAGSFGFVFTAVDAFGCSADTTVFITVEPGLDFTMGSSPLDPLAGVEATLCAGLPLTIQANSVGPLPPGTSFNWLLDGAASGQVGTTYIDLSPDTGQHEILFQATTVAPPPIVGLCQFEWTDTIEVVVPPTLSLNVPDACTNEPVLWETSASGEGLNWNWILTTAEGDTLSNVSWADPVIGTQPSGAFGLEAMVTDVHGCADTATASFEVFASPDAGFSLEEVCAGEVLAYELNDPVGYVDSNTSATWSLVGGAMLTDEGGHLGTAVTGGGGFPQITLDLVTVHPEGITCDATESQFAMVHSSPAVAIVGPASACEGEDAAWLGWTSVPFPGSVVSSHWSLDGGLSLTQTGGDTLSLMEPPVGVYGLSLMAVSDQGCESIQTFEFEVVTMPHAGFVLPSLVCAEETVAAAASWPLDSVTTHSWTANGQPLVVSGGSYPTSLTSVPGTVEVQHTVSIGGCSDTAIAALEVSPLPVAGIAGPDLACAGEPVVWTDNSVNPTASALNKTWMPMYAGAPSPSSGVLYDFGSPVPGDYGMALAVTTAAGCSDTLEASLFVGATPDAAFALDAVCAGAPVPVTLSDPAGYSAANPTWQWNGSPLSVSNPTELPAAFSAAAGPQTATLNLALFHPGITCTSAHTTAVDVYAQPVAAMVAPADFCAGPDAAFADATVVDAGTLVTLDWSLDIGSGPVPWGMDPTAVLSAPDPGTYAVTLTATTADGCTSAAAESVTVYTAADATFALPSQVCAGSPIGVSASMAGLGSWTANGQPLVVSGGSYPASLTSVPGTVEVQHTVSIGGCSDTAIAALEVSPLPVAGIAGPDLACAGEPVVWTDNSVNPTASALNKTWMPMYAGAPSPSSGVLYDFGSPVPGDYGMALAVTTAAGCSDTLEASLFVGATPDAAFALDAVCAGAPVPVTLSDPAGYSAANPTWQWNGSPLSVSNPTELPAAFSAAAGPQTATLNLALFHPGITCTSAHTTAVDVYAQPVAAMVAPADFCAGPDAAFADATVVDAGTLVTLDWSLDIGSGPVPWGMDPTAVLSAPDPGTYAVTLTATTADGCTSAAAESVTVYTAPLADFTLPTTVCTGDAVDVPSLSTSGATAWTLNGQPLATDAGGFSAALTSDFGSQVIAVTVSLGEGPDQCLDQHEEVLEVQAYPAVDFIGPEAACDGEAVNWLEDCTHPQGLPMGMTWDVDDSAMSSTGMALDLSGLATGSHEVVLTVSGPAGCTASSQGTFDVHPVPVAAFSLSETCSGQPLTWTPEAPDSMFFGVATWSWEGTPLEVVSDTLPLAVSTVPGLPTVMVQLTMAYSTGVSCSALDSADAVVYETPQASIGGPAHLCAGDTGTFVGAGGAMSNALNFEWAADAAAIEEGEAPEVLDFVATSAGLYSVSLEVSGPGGCSADTAAVVEVLSTPEADFELPLVACAGDPVPLTLGTAPTEGGQIDTTWTWNGVPIESVAGALPASLTSTPGMQLVTLQVTLSEGGTACVSETMEQVQIHAMPEVVWDLPAEVCSGWPLTISSTSQVITSVPLTSTWTWSHLGASTETVGADLDAGMPVPGVYDATLAVEGSGGCTAQLMGVVTAHPSPVAEFTAANVCEGEPMAVEMTDETGFSSSLAAWTWNGNATTVSNGVLSPMVSAVYGPQMLGLSLSTTFASGHVCTDSHMVTADVWPTPEADWDATGGLCEGDAAVFSSSSAVANNEVLLSSWYWEAASGTILDSGDVVSFGVPSTGLNNLELVVNTLHGCADTLATMVEVHPLPVVDFSMDAVCQGQPIEVQWTEAELGAEVGYTWTWEGGEISLTDNMLPIEVSTNAGVQSVQLVASQSYLTGAVCTAMQVSPVDVLAAPQAAVSSDTLWCEGESAVVHEANNGGGEWTCQWFSDIGSAVGPEWQLPDDAVGNIASTLTVTNGAGCSDTVSFNVRIDPLPEVMLSDTVVMDCAPFSPELQVYATGYSGAVLSTLWTWAGGQSQSQGWSEEVGEGAWPVSCTVTAGDVDLQCTSTAVASVVGLEVPQATFSMYPEQPTTRQREVELTAEGPSPSVALDWSVNGTPAGTGAFVGYTFAPYFGDIYEVCLTATSPFGCADETCREVEVIGEVQVYVPSGFTPDNDGVNDLFLPSVSPLEQVEDYRLEVYNRWGDLVFLTEDPEQGWMGAYASGSHFAGNEVFNWVITIDTQLGLPRRWTGQVTVIR